VTPLLKKIRDRNIWLVYAAILDLGIAYGISISLIAHHLDARGFTKSQMGSLAAWFALGIVSFSIPAGAIVRRVSAKRTLMVCLAGYAVCVSIFPWLRSYEAIAAARVLDGAFSVGVWVSCETILLARASDGIKALVTSVYAMSIAVGYVLGPLVARGLVAFAPMWVAFGCAGVLTVGAVVLASLLDRDAANVGAEDASLALAGVPKARLTTLVYRIKTSCFATFAYGYFQASVVLFLPLFLEHEKNVDKGRTIIIPAFFAAGMLLFSNVAGRLGDRYGHLLLMRWLGAIGLVMVLGFELLDSYPLMCVAVFVAGATLASISPVSLALQGVVTDRVNLSRSNGIYNAFYAAGMLLGPAASGRLFERYGGGVMLDHLAIMWAAFVLFCIVFRRDDPASMPGRSRALLASAAPGPGDEAAEEPVRV
jgi:MFS family permease